MRILMVSQWFDPEPANRGLVFARELVRRGHEVQVLTGFPHYPGGKLYDGYRVRPLQREQRDAVSVLRVPLYPSHDGSPLRRVATYGTFALAVSSLGPLLVKPADVVYAYQLPSVALAAAVIGRTRGMPLVFDVQDLWPDALEATGMVRNQLFLDLAAESCQLAYRAASRIVVLSPGVRRLLVERGVPARKVSLIYNWCDEVRRPPERDDSLGRKLGLEGRFNVLFAGNMGKAQALDAVLDAAKLIAASSPTVQFVFVGDGVESARLRSRVRLEGIRNCLFLARRPVTEMGGILALADVVLVHLRDDESFRVTIPSKTQAYMAAGRPILMAARGDAADLVQQAGAGLCCAPEAPHEMAQAVMLLQSKTREEREQLGINGQSYYERKLSMKRGVDQFDNLFRELAQQEDSSPSS